MRIAICDDMDIYLKELNEILTKFFQDKDEAIEIDEFSTGEDLVSVFAIGKYDIIILDIEMKELNGLQTAHEIRKLDKTVVIAFNTSYDRLSTSKYDIGSYTLMNKGQSLEKYNNQLKKMFDTYKLNNTTFHADCGDTPIKNIIYFKKSWGKVKMHTITGSHEISGTLDEIVLPGFAKTSKKHCVNMMFVDKIFDGILVLDSGENLPVKHDYYNMVKQVYMDSLL